MKIDSRFYAWSIVLYPWLSIYGTFINGVSVGDLLLLIDLVYIAFFSRNGFQIRKPLSVRIHVLFLTYCLLSVCFISLFVDVNFWFVAKRFLKYTLFIVVIIYMCKGACNKEEFYRGFTIFSRVSCVAIVIQYLVFYSMGKYVEFKIPLLKYCNDVVESIDYTSSALISFRPHSLFLEPAHFTYFISMYLIFLLFNSNRVSRINRIGEAIVVTACMISSVSSTAIIVAAIVWVSYLIQVLCNRKAEFVENNRLLIIVIIAICAIVGFRFYMSSPQLSYSLNRLLFSQNETLATSTWGRLDSGKSLVESLNFAQKLFGMGLGNLPSASTYLSSVYYILYCTGYLGAIIYVIWGVHAFIESSLEGKLILVVVVALCVSSPIIISGYIMLYNALIYLPQLYIECDNSLNKEG